MKRYIFPDPPENLDAHCELQPDSMGSAIVGAHDTHPSNGAPCISFNLPDGIPNNNGAWLRITKRGYASIEQHGLLDTITAGAGGFQCDVFTLQKLGSIRPFVLDGRYCRFSDDGTEMLINESTAFRLFARYRAGEARADQFAQACVDNRINMIRVSGMQDTSLYLTDPMLQYRIFPDDPTYYLDLDAFMDWTGSYGLYVDFVACMQTQTLMPDRNSQARHLQQLYDVLHGRNCFLSKVNEQYQHDNSIEDGVRLMPKPAGATFLLSNGSKGAGDESVLDPVQDLIEYHDNDVNEWWRKDHNAWEMGNNNGNRAAYTSESTRTDNDSALNHFEDAGKTQAAMTLACIIHTPEGKNADPFNFSLAHIAAHNKGVFDGGVNFRRGQYERHINPDVLREYSMTINGVYRWQVRF